MDVRKVKMKTQDIKNMAAAMQQVAENQKAAMAKKLSRAAASSEKGKAAVSLPKAPWDKKKEEVEEMSSKEKMKKGLYNSKMDPVDKKELKGKHDDREDGDIDNDGDADSTDKYLHNRRKAISKNMKKEEADETTPCPKCDGSTENHEADCPLSKEGNGNDDEVATANPKQEKKMANEGTVYARILEKRHGGKGEHLKGAAAPEGMNDKSKSSKGAMDMLDTPKDVDDTEQKGHQDVAAAGRAGPKAKARPNDNMKGDKTVINPPKEAK